MNLYDVSNEYIDILNECSGEEVLSDELVQKLENINEAFEEKAKNIAFVINELKSDCEKIENEEKRLKDRRERKLKNLENLKEYLKGRMIAVGKSKIETPIYTISVMDSSNRAMKSRPYTYDTRYKKGIVVEAATMFDINKTIMRCLVKNLAMFGLGLYIYAGENLPKELAPKERKKSASAEPLAKAITIKILEKEIEKFKEKSEKLRENIALQYNVDMLKELREDQAREAILTIKRFKKKA